MMAKLKLLKNISIDLLVILLSCINLTYAYLTLFLNEKPFLFKKTNVSAKYAMISLFFIGFPA